MSPESNPAVPLIPRSDWILLMRLRIAECWRKHPFTQVEELFELARVCAITRQRLYGSLLTKFKEKLPFPPQRFSQLAAIGECDALKHIDPTRLPLGIETMYLLTTLPERELNRRLTPRPSRRRVLQWKHAINAGENKPV